MKPRHTLAQALIELPDAELTGYDELTWLRRELAAHRRVLGCALLQLPDHTLRMPMEMFDGITDWHVKVTDGGFDRAMVFRLVKPTP